MAAEAAAAVAIVGAGPSGLALARLLECQGVSYVVYERDASPDAFPQRAGGTLDIHAATGQRAIAEGGLLEAFAQHARYDASTFQLWDRRGVRYIHHERGSDFPEIDRADLRRIYLDAVPAHKIRWGHGLKRVSVGGGDDGKPVLEFADGTTASGFRLVVGADGAWSKVRALVNPVGPQYCGIHMIESRISPGNPVHSQIQARVGKGMMVIGGPNKSIILQNLGDGSYRLYLGMRAPADLAKNGKIDFSDTEAMRALCLSGGDGSDDDGFFGPGWTEEVHVYIRHSTDFRSWPIYHIPPASVAWDRDHDRHSVPGGVTLIGDSAHVGPPSGEGANFAMTDALYLAEKIAAHGLETDEGRDRAVREYEGDMFARGAGLIERGLEMMKMMYAEDGPQPFIDFFRGKGVPISGEENSSSKPDHVASDREQQVV